MAAGDALSARDVPLRGRTRGRISLERSRVRVMCRSDGTEQIPGDFSISISARIPVPWWPRRYGGLVFYGVVTRRWGKRRAAQRSDTRRHRCRRRRRRRHHRCRGRARRSSYDTPLRAFSSRGALVRCVLLSRVPLDDRSRGGHCAEFRTRFRRENAPPSWGRD